MSQKTNPFSRLAREYDAWFDSPDGRDLFELERRALVRLQAGRKGRWLEVGAGTGRFARSLGIAEGLEPAEGMSRLAVARGVRIVGGEGEHLPFRAGSYEGILFVVAICFLSDPAAVFRECRRVLKVGGWLVAGIIPAAGPWGREYARRARSGHRYYAGARFYDAGEIARMASAAGLVAAGAASCLYDAPGALLRDKAIRPGADEMAGFVALRFRNPG